MKHFTHIGPVLLPSVIVPNEEDLESKLYKDLEIFIEEIPMTRYALQGYAYARSIEKEMDMEPSYNLEHSITSNNTNIEDILNYHHDSDNLREYLIKQLDTSSLSEEEKKTFS